MAFRQRRWRTGRETGGNLAPSGTPAPLHAPLHAHAPLHFGICSSSASSENGLTSGAAAADEIPSPRASRAFTDSSVNRDAIPTWFDSTERPTGSTNAPETLPFGLVRQGNTIRAPTTPEIPPSSEARSQEAPPSGAMSIDGLDDKSSTPCLAASGSDRPNFADVPGPPGLSRYGDVPTGWSQRSCPGGHDADPISNHDMSTGCPAPANIRTPDFLRGALASSTPKEERTKSNSSNPTVWLHKTC